MAKIDGTDASFFMNSSAYSKAKSALAGEKPDDKKIRSQQKTSFTSLIDSLRGKTADELGPLQNLPVSEEAINELMDDVRSSGDVLLNRPFPEEIFRYKQAVRNFLNYVIKNGFSLEYEEGIKNKFKPSFKGRRTAPDADNSKSYTKISIVDKKLEDLAAMLISKQMRQMELVSRLEEIRGLLVDLLE